MDNVTRRIFAGGAALAVLGVAMGASAQQPVKIGVIYPLSGNSASAGNYSKMAIEVGADVINNGNAELAKIMPIAKGGGLSGLGGAKIQLIFADNQGTPAAGQNQALRLISEEKVAALIGAYQSGITVTASAIAERHGIPFLTAEIIGDPDPTGMPVVEIRLDQAGSGISGPELLRRLSTGSPRIEANPWKAEEGRLILSPASLRDGDPALIGRRLAEILRPS